MLPMNPRLILLMNEYLDSCKIGDIFGNLDFIEYVKERYPKSAPARSQVGRIVMRTGRCKSTDYCGYYEVIA